MHLVAVRLEDLHLAAGAAGADAPRGVARVGARLVPAPGVAVEDGAQRGQAAHDDAEAEFDAGGLLACGAGSVRDGVWWGGLAISR